jgi:hypothetical protein
VGDDDQLGVGASPVLPYGLDRHLVLGEDWAIASTPATSATEGR